MDTFEIGAVAGVVLSLAWKYVPRIKGWFEKQEPETKELINLGVMIGVVGAAFGLSCINWFDIYACTQMGLKDAIVGLVGAMIGNAGAYVTLKHLNKG